MIATLLGHAVQLSGLDILWVALAGLAAGGINSVVGSGTLITFPLLLALGYPPVMANVSNTVGLVPGSAMGAVGYRRELVGQGKRVTRLAIGSLIGGAIGATLLLQLPASAFKAIVPVLVGLGVVLVIVGPWLNRWLAERRTHPHPTGASAGLFAGVTAVAVYGGYFGAAQGVLLIAIMGIFLDEELQRINAAKNVLAGLTNLVAAVIFIIFSHIAWLPALVIAGSSAVGGGIGGRYGRRIPANLLRGVIVIVGVITIVRLV